MIDTSAPRSGRPNLLDRHLGLTGNGTTVRTESVAGVTTFLTMVYIVFVNPDILANAGMDRGAGRFAGARPVVALAALFAVS